MSADPDPALEVERVPVLADGARRVAMVLAYDGTAFSGWQLQDGHRTVQGELERSLGLLSGGERIVVEGSGRTDAGVHARAQVAHADLSRVALGLRHRLNAVLPGDVRVRGVAKLDADFHARHDAVGKTYRYRLDVGPVASPFTSRFSLHVPERLDLDAMAQGARLFEGARDFASLRSAGSSAKTTHREITRCVLEGEPPDLAIVVEGTGFLRHMVRALAGSLLDVGRGRHDAAWIEGLLAATDRAAAGPNAPAHGLCLESVRYPAPWQAALDAAVAEERA